MVIFPLAPDQTIAQMWSNGARGGVHGQPQTCLCLYLTNKSTCCRSYFSCCERRQIWLRPHAHHITCTSL